LDFDWPPDWLPDLSWVTDKFESFGDWASSRVESLNLDSTSLGISFITALIMAVLLLDPPIDLGMSNIPLLSRIIVIVLAPVVSYVIVSKMLNR
jgi:uncharacterized protein YacL